MQTEDETEDEIMMQEFQQLMIDGKNDEIKSRIEKNKKMITIPSADGEGCPCRLSSLVE